MDQKSEFERRIAAIHGLSDPTHKNTRENSMDIRRAELQAMADSFLGEGYDRTKLKQVEDLQLALHKQRVELYRSYEVGTLSPEKYVDLFNKRLAETFEQCEKILGSEDFLKLFGAPRSKLSGFIDKEIFLKTHETRVEELSHLQTLKGKPPRKEASESGEKREVKGEMSVSAVGSPGLEKNVGNFALIDTLREWGIIHYSGVNGGGVVHVTKYLIPLTNLSQVMDGVPRFLTMGEYASGFMPLGYYLASGRVACSITTTGAATKLGSSGITDAKLHNIPALFLIALNSTGSIGKAPLQDVSEYGMNIVPQLQAELGDGCIVIDNIHRLEQDLVRAQSILQESRPVAIAFHPDILSREIQVDVPKTEVPRILHKEDVEAFLKQFPPMAKKRRVIIYVGEEAAFCPNIQELTTELSELLQAPTVWSMNGANAVSHKNPYGYGYIMFGGNDKAMELWRNMNQDDILITLGFCPGEYSINLESIPAKYVWHIGAYMHGYGQIKGDFRHRCKGGYTKVRGDIAFALEEIIPRLKAMGVGQDRPKVEKPDNLNFREVWRDVRKDCVDFMSFYQEVQKHWQPHSIGFDDVCIAYKDRQYVMQRPHPHIKFWSMHHGSAMGGAFGLGLGAKLADPSLHTFIFAGDGCWRLFGGCLADAAKLDLRLFIINNGTYGIVDKGLEIIIPTVEKPRYHSKLPSIDFVGAAKAHGWEGFNLKPDLSNLKEIMDACNTPAGKSILVDVPVDNEQVVGLNARLLNLTTQAYL